MIVLIGSGGALRIDSSPGRQPEEPDENERVAGMNDTIRESIYDTYSLHRSRDETGVMTDRGIWWTEKEIVEVRVTKNCLLLIFVSRRPSFVPTPVKTLSLFFNTRTRNETERRHTQCSEPSGDPAGIMPRGRDRWP